MNPAAASFLSVLQEHAVHRGDLLAHVLPDRDITYRRLWSRIERASARLQGEWGIRAGDLVAYVGSGHPDAIVLYFALLRIGASLLPLEALPAAEARAAFAAHGATLAIHDDGVNIDDMSAHGSSADGLSTDGMAARPLESLLADWCHFDPVLVSDESLRRGLWLPLAGGQREAASLFELTIALPAEPRAGWVSDRLFTAEVLGRLVLPSLRDARRLYFAATEPQQRTGS